MTTNETHTGLSRAADKAQDVVGGMMGRAAARTAGSGDADAFVENASRGDMLEIAAAKYVLKHSRNDAVRAVASRMIDDHTTMTHQLHSALLSSETPDLKVPDDLGHRRKQILDHLEAAPQEKLDKTYIDQQVLAHKETVDLMEGYAGSGENAQLRSVAQSAAPVVRRHLAYMEALQSSI